MLHPATSCYFLLHLIFLPSTLYTLYFLVSLYDVTCSTNFQIPPRPNLSTVQSSDLLDLLDFKQGNVVLIAHGIAHGEKLDRMGTVL